jgi:hypothetical protein
LSLLKWFSGEMKKEAGTELLPLPRQQERGNSDGDDEMKTKLAGHLPLQEAIARTIEEAREKMKLASDDKSDKVKKLVEYEKKEHGGKVPSVKEEKDEDCEKTSSVIDPMNSEEVEKLAEALEYVADEFEKEADSIDNGGEKAQGGQQLPTQSPESGKQSYKKDSPAKHSVPMKTGLQTAETSGDSKTQVPNDHARAPGGTAKMPANVLRKMGGLMPSKSDAVMGGGGVGGAIGIANRNLKKGPAMLGKVSSVQALKNAIEKTAKEYGKSEKEEHKRIARGASRVGGALYGASGAAAGAAAGKAYGGTPGALIGGVGGAALGYGVGKGVTYAGVRGGNRVARAIGGDSKEEKSKKSSADPVAYIMGKIAESAKSASVENGAESAQGGEQLSNTAPVPSNPGRQLISSNAAPKAATKREAKSPRKAELAQVLTEPAFSAAKDNKVNQNLRNAAKGGVKIAAARAFLAKVAAEGCKCDSAGTCQNCTMKAKISSVRETTGTEATA